jgi:hypothetical protein
MRRLMVCAVLALSVPGGTARASMYEYGSDFCNDFLEARSGSGAPNVNRYTARSRTPL